MSSDKLKSRSGPEELVGGIPVRAVREEFESDEMLDCRDCGRKTPPNRLECFYCGAALAVTGAEEKRIRPFLRPPKEDEPGFSIVYVNDGRGPDPEQLALAAAMMRIEPDNLRVLMGTPHAAPVGRSGSEKDALTAARRLRETGANVSVFKDVDFETGKPQKRLRSVAFGDEGRLDLILFNNDAVEKVSNRDLALIVVGIVLENRVEADEKHKRTGNNEVLNTIEVSADEVLIDIYKYDSPTAFRIQAAGFDFSFLGTEKDLLAVKNLEKTLAALREFAPGAVFNDSYPELRSKLNMVWEINERKDAKGLKRRAFGSYEKKRVVTSSNDEQFTKFSRLQWFMLSKISGGDS